MSETPVRLKRFEIKALFGSIDVDVSLDLEARVTVLYGLNGSGKTATLNLLYAVCSGQYDQLDRYPFERLKLTLSGGESLEISDDSKDSSLYQYEAKVGDRVKSGAFLPTTNGPIFLEEEPPESLHLPWFSKTLSSTRLIPIDRRHTDSKGPHETDRILMVDEISQDIEKMVQEADRAYRAISTDLDGSLPQRIFKQMDDVPSLDLLKQIHRDLITEEAYLQSLGLMKPPAPVNESDLKEENRGTLHIILQDRKKKLAAFQDVVDRTQRILEVLNRKFERKTVKLTAEGGYQIITESGEQLPLERLSSGEQHELILQHELLFRTKPGSLILVDEPELSMHVSWQSSFLSDFIKIAPVNDLHLIVATHSPYIANDYPELIVHLGGPA